MNRVAIGSILATAILRGCVTPAPGANQVRITKNRADVAACTAVGNIGAESMHNLDPDVAKNKAVGLGANLVFDTGDGGVAYRCN